METNEFREKLNEVTGKAREQFKHIEGAARSVDAYTHKEPWVMAGILAAFAAILGYILGRLSGSRRRD